MIVKLTRWTGETREIETASVALALVHEYPDFATSDQNENGWICWDEPDERYGTSPKVAVYNVYGDWCATIEETRGAGIITPTPQNESTAIEKILNDDEECTGDVYTDPFEAE